MSIPNFTLAKLVLRDLNTKLVQIAERLRNLSTQGVLSSEGGGTGTATYRLGDMLYGLASGITVLLGNATTTKKFLAQTGDGVNSAAPAWTQPTASDLSNGTTGTGAVVLASSPTIATPTIASFTNAQHNHQNAAGGGTLDGAAIASTITGTGNVVKATGPTVTSVNVSDGALSLNGYAKQCFVLVITNTAGTLQHRVQSHFGVAALGAFSGKITSASATFANTPYVTAAVGFTNGFGISNATKSVAYFDVAVAQVAASAPAGQVSLAYNDCNVAQKVRAALAFGSENVNGTTRLRPEIAVMDPDTAAPVSIDTALIPAGKTLVFAIDTWII